MLQLLDIMLLASVPALHAGLMRIKHYYISIITTHTSMLYIGVYSSMFTTPINTVLTMQ